jgi:hypothetical protein
MQLSISYNPGDTITIKCDYAKLIFGYNINSREFKLSIVETFQQLATSLDKNTDCSFYSHISNGGINVSVKNDIITFGLNSCFQECSFNYKFNHKEKISFSKQITEIIEQLH